jgi:hypothetical protein
MTYWMNVSLDLRIERSTGDHVAGEEGGEWARIDEQLFREFNERARGLALFVEGRIIYEMMETLCPQLHRTSRWPTTCGSGARSGRPHRRYWSPTHAPPLATTRASSVALTPSPNSPPFARRRTAQSESEAPRSQRSCCNMGCSMSYCSTPTRRSSAHGRPGDPLAALPAGPRAHQLPPPVSDRTQSRRPVASLTARPERGRGAAAPKAGTQPPRGSAGGLGDAATERARS